MKSNTQDIHMSAPSSTTDDEIVIDINGLKKAFGSQEGEKNISLKVFEGKNLVVV